MMPDITIERPCIRVLPDGRMDRENAVKYLGVKPKTLATWACQNKGPKVIRVGGRVFYFREDLDAFIQGGRCRATSDYPSEVV